MSKLLFCDYQPNGLGIKLLRLKPGVPGGGWGRDQNPDNTDNRKPDSLGELKPLDVFDEEALERSRNEEKDAEAALDQAIELVMSSNGPLLTDLARLQIKAASPEANSSARDVVADTRVLESSAYDLGTKSSKLAQIINNDLRLAVKVLTIRTLIREIYEIIQKLEESPSTIDDLQLLLWELESHFPNEHDNPPHENPQLQNKQLAQAVQAAIQDAKKLVTTIKQRFRLFPLLPL